VPNGFVSTNGSFSYFQAAEDYNPLVSFKAHLSGSNVTGTMRQEQKVDTGGVTGTCDSGNISWTGHRVG
jgi:hypothetical protein